MPDALPDWLEEIERGNAVALQTVQPGKTAYQMRALIAEVRRLRAEREWRDIASAPKDGTTIFGAHWRMAQRGMVHFNSDGRWEMVNGLTNWPNGKFFEPTHWQPLPSPPEGE